MQNTVNQRINLLVTHFTKGVRAAFAQQVGVSQQGIHNLLSGRQGEPSFKVLAGILKAYPSVNADWLMTGQGQMLRGESTAAAAPEIPQYVTREQYSAFTDEMNKRIREQEQLFEAYKYDLSEKAQLEQVYRIGDIHPANKKLADRLSISPEEARELVLSGRIRSTYVGKDTDRARQNGVSYLISEAAVREFLGDRAVAK